MEKSFSQRLRAGLTYPTYLLGIALVTVSGAVGLLADQNFVWLFPLLTVFLGSLTIPLWKAWLERRFGDSRSENPEGSVADAFAELRALCKEEEYVLEIPPRQNRPNPFADELDDLPE